VLQNQSGESVYAHNYNSDFKITFIFLGEPAFCFTERGLAFPTLTGVALKRMSKGLSATSSPSKDLEKDGKSEGKRTREVAIAEGSKQGGLQQQQQVLLPSPGQGLFRPQAVYILVSILSISKNLLRSNKRVNSTCFAEKSFCEILTILGAPIPRITLPQIF
jgi:hypothetical protein